MKRPHSSASHSKRYRPLPASEKHRRWFRIVALFAVPCLVIIFLEILLRLEGYGYSTAFFRVATVGQQKVIVENPSFGQQFFPPHLVRLPSPTVFPTPKQSNTARIFILGESAALGDPEPAFGFGRYLEVLLNAQLPEKQWEVIPAAMTAINSHALLPIARDCARQQGDVWIVYMGNNEIVGPFGAGTVFGPQSPPRPVIRLSLILKKFRFYQLLEDWSSYFNLSSEGSASWQGMSMFANSQRHFDDPRRQRTYEQFEQNLDAILKIARKAGVTVILCTVATNIKDCAPFASLNAPALTASQQKTWNEYFQTGIQFESNANWSAAIHHYEAAAAVDSKHADLQFRLGRGYFALQELNNARQHFEAARDYDALAFRATSQINSIIRKKATEYANHGVVFLDVEENLTMANLEAPDENQFFYEHVHLNFAGNYQLATLAADKIAKLPQFLAIDSKPTWLSQGACDEMLAVTPWDRHRIYANILQRHQRPPFTFQLNHADQVDSLKNKLLELRKDMQPSELATARIIYQNALNARPNDFLIHGNFAKLLEGVGDFQSALKEWQRVRELIPHHFGPNFYLGKLYARLGQFDEAEQLLNRTVQMRPDAAEAMIELGNIRLRKKDPASALAFFEKALKLQPANARLHFSIAEAKAALEKRDEAIESLRRAIEFRPDYWEARYLLGVELATRGEFTAATEQFRAVVRLNPEHVSAHFNLGVALAKENRIPEALHEFEETARLAPTHALALDYLQKLKQLEMKRRASAQ